LSAGGLRKFTLQVVLFLLEELIQPARSSLGIKLSQASSSTINTFVDMTRSQSSLGSEQQHASELVPQQ
jgi:hypothetical protein